MLVALTLTAAVLVLLVPLWRGAPRLYGTEELEPAVHTYAADEPAACPPGSRSAAGSADERSASGIRYAVKTPANYDPTSAHPLIIVYAPHAAHRDFSERYVGLTREATRDGFVVAYVDARLPTRRALDDLGSIPRKIAARWCIDARRVSFTGHSDGGTTATALAVHGKSGIRPLAIAPSAAGFRRDDFSAVRCPPTLAVLVLHAADDELFPGYGREAVEWWAACNGCGSAPESRADGCLAYPGCRRGGETVYCEGKGGHNEWPRRNTAILDFFRAAASR